MEANHIAKDLITNPGHRDNHNRPRENRSSPRHKNIPIQIDDHKRVIRTERHAVSTQGVLDSEFGELLEHNKDVVGSHSDLLHLPAARNVPNDRGGDRRQGLRRPARHGDAKVRVFRVNGAQFGLCELPGCDNGRNNTTGNALTLGALEEAAEGARGEAAQVLEGGEQVHVGVGVDLQQRREDPFQL